MELLLDPGEGDNMSLQNIAKSICISPFIYPKYLSVIEEI
jgi:hypothetical protein